MIDYSLTVNKSPLFNEYFLATAVASKSLTGGVSYRFKEEGAFYKKV